MTALRRPATPALLLGVAALIAGCGGGGKGDSTVASSQAAPQPPPRSVRPGPGCRPRTAPGSVANDSIGEDVIGTPVRRFERCFGPPVQVEVRSGAQTLFYDVRGEDTQWAFEVSHGRISGAGGTQTPPDNGVKKLLALGPVLGLDCPASSVRCEVVGLHLILRHAAAAVTVTTAGRAVRLSNDVVPPDGRVFDGRLRRTGLRRGSRVVVRIRVVDRRGVVRTARARVRIESTFG